MRMMHSIGGIASWQNHEQVRLRRGGEGRGGKGSGGEGMG